MDKQSKRPLAFATPTRREALFGMGAGLGSVALASILQSEAGAAVHHTACAKRCIFLMMEGGPSHLDTFDPKPELTKQHLKAFTRQGESESAMSSGKRYFVKSPFEFTKAGQCGADISSPWVHLRERVDDICFYRGAQVDSVNHPTACYQLNTGNQFGGDPGVGAWVTYGLGTENENLPGFVGSSKIKLPTGRSGQLVQRLLAREVSRHTAETRGQPHPKSATAACDFARPTTTEPGFAGQV